MSHPRRALSLSLTGLISLAVIACSSTPSGTVSPSIPAIPSISIPAIPTISIPAIPSFSIPVIPSGLPSISVPPVASFDTHQVPDLEAALPATLRGVTLERASYKGDLFLSGSGSGNEQFKAVLSQFSKQPSDLAIGGASDPTQTLKFQLLVFRLSGVDAIQLLAAFIAAGAANGETPPTITSGNVGGKQVTITTDSNGTKSFVYAKNDMLFVVGSEAADADALIAEILAALP